MAIEYNKDHTYYRLTWTDIYTGMNDILATNFPNVKRIAEAQKYNIGEEAFYFGLLNTHLVNYQTKEKLNFSITLNYLPPNGRTDKVVEVLDKLTAIFFERFKVKDRHIFIIEREFNIISNILSMKLDLLLWQNPPLYDGVGSNSGKDIQVPYWEKGNTAMLDYMERLEEDINDRN